MRNTSIVNGFINLSSTQLKAYKTYKTCYEITIFGTPNYQSFY
jgi:hypothetical protein